MIKPVVHDLTNFNALKNHPLLVKARDIKRAVSGVVYVVLTSAKDIPDAETALKDCDFCGDSPEYVNGFHVIRALEYGIQ